MASPTANQIQLPGLLEPIVVDGKNDYKWYQWVSLVQDVIGAGNASIGGLQVQINQVSGVANQAETTATLALVRANTALTTADSAIVTGTINTNSINTINNSLIGFLLKANNLGDVSNAATARSNLGLSTNSYIITFDTCPINLTRYIGIDVNCLIRQNFTGCLATSGVNTTNNATFSIGYARGLPGTISITPIGTLTFINGGNFYNFVGNATQLLVGDFLTITTPSSADPNLAQVGITIQTILTS